MIYEEMITMVMLYFVALANFVVTAATLLPMQNLLTAHNQIPIKMLEAPRQSFQNQFQQQQPVKTVPPRPPAGPAHLISVLHGRCYTILVKSQYEYKFCPFDNATQRDISAYHAFSGFHGVIGVWDGWYIDSSVDNLNKSRLVAMAMPNGAPCGGGSENSKSQAEQRRRTLVKFICSNSTRLASVIESPMCNYLMLFETPLVCPEDSALLAYPSLTEPFQSAWDALNTLLHRRIISKAGYKLLLDNLLFKAGLLSDTRESSHTTPNTVSMDTQASATEKFIQKKTPVKSIAEEISALQKQLQIESEKNTAK